jgi:D-tyrosyl-tRNA(Tyr) deacylase
LIQRVLWARVQVDGETVSSIGPGLLILLGVAAGDGEAEADRLASKTAALRIFEDEGGKMNLSVRDAGGEALVVSQFTLLADSRKGNRPGYSNAAPPETAQELYGRYLESLASEGVPTASGVFRAHMVVSLANDGPVTILLESR